jgi:uncharacterized protein YjbI with pentapeptide repeats
MTTPSLFTDDEYEQTSFEKIRAQGLSLTDKTFSSCVFTGCDLSGCDFSSSLLENCEFIECNLSSVVLNSTRMPKVSFTGSKIMGVNFTNAEPFAMTLSFTGCAIDSCNFCDMKLKKTVFSGCELIATDFLRADLTEADFSGSSFRDIGFENTTLAKSDFTDAHGYVINPMSNNVRKAKFSFSDAVIMLEQMGIIIK